MYLPCAMCFPISPLVSSFLSYFLFQYNDLGFSYIFFAIDNLDQFAHATADILPCRCRSCVFRCNANFCFPCAIFYSCCLSFEFYYTLIQLNLSFPHFTRQFHFTHAHLPMSGVSQSPWHTTTHYHAIASVIALSLSIFFVINIEM